MNDVEHSVGQHEVLIASGTFLRVDQVRDGHVVLSTRARQLRIPFERVDTLLRDPISEAEARDEIERLQRFAPFTGEDRRLRVALAMDGSEDQRLAALGTALDWYATAPPPEERAAQLGSDPDWAEAISYLVREEEARFAEWNHVLHLGLEQDELIEHFVRLRARGPRNERIVAPESPPQPQASHDLPHQPERRIVGTLTLRGPVVVGDATWVDDPLDHVEVPVVAGTWTVAAVATPDPEFPEREVGGRTIAGGVRTWLLLVRGLSSEVQVADGSIEIDGGPRLPLNQVGRARVESGLLAMAASPPETAGRSIRFAPGAELSVWPWGVHYGVGGDGWFEVFTASDEAGVAAVATVF